MAPVGTGLQLDESFDLQVDQTSGEIARTDGIAQLKKTLTYRVRKELDDSIGTPEPQLSPEKTRARIIRAVQDDDRVETVTNVAIDPSAGNSDTLGVSLTLTVDGDTVSTTVTP